MIKEAPNEQEENGDHKKDGFQFVFDDELSEPSSQPVQEMKEDLGPKLPKKDDDSESSSPSLEADEDYPDEEQKEGYVHDNLTVSQTESMHSHSQNPKYSNRGSANLRQLAGAFAIRSPGVKRFAADDFGSLVAEMLKLEASGMQVPANQTKGQAGLNKSKLNHLYTPVVLPNKGMFSNMNA